ncbi:PEP-CTERM sorting domain-containing protein [Rugamonas sp.]|uniref:PEP-CTERM sorting domain-containing protein n=1 Tax=Rugamonas sp. TaxID=1926287 RepID=UPI0025DD81ED|nr:PEP-CTERM sorting domain-containing protein [Rugamonas sp.]
MKRIARSTLAAACAAAVVAVAAAGPAHAAASSSATFGNLTITLTDLDPNDGIAPSLIYQADAQPTIMGETRSFGDEFVQHTFNKVLVGQQGGLNGALNDELASSNASLTSAVTLAGFSSASASGKALSTVDGNGRYFAEATGQDPYMNSFTLSANTMMTITVNGSARAQTTIGYNLDAFQAEEANAHLFLDIEAYTDNGTYVGGYQETTLQALYEVKDDGSVVGQTQSWDGQMSASFSNKTGQSASGFFVADVDVSGLSSVAAVPEPETYAMLMAGLALVGWGAKRAKRRQA